MATRKASAPKRSRNAKQGRKAPALPLEVDPSQIETSLLALKEQVVRLAKKGRYTKVRFKFRGKQLLPDIPLAAVVAAEGATFYWAGLLRALIFTLAGRSLLEVELVNDSAQQLATGKEALLSGDLDEALAAFRRAAEMDSDNPTAHLHLGIALKLRGELTASRKALNRARELDPKGPTAQEAERLLKTLPGGAR